MKGPHTGGSRHVHSICELNNDLDDSAGLNEKNRVHVTVLILQFLAQLPFSASARCPFSRFDAGRSQSNRPNSKSDP